MKSKLLNSKHLRFLGLVIFILILWTLDVQYVLEQFKQMRSDLFLIALVVLVTFHVLKAFRWRYILSIQRIHYSFIDSYLIYLSGLFVGLMTPGRMGDFVKIFYMKADGFSAIKAMFSSFIDRMLDILFLFLCGTLSLLWISCLLPIREQLLLTIVVPLLSAVVIGKSLGMEKIRKLILKLVPKTYMPLFKEGMSELKATFRNYSFWKLITLIILTVVGWLLYFTVIYVLTRSISLSMPFVEVVALFVISTLITFVPITFAGVGTRDVTLVVLFSRLGYIKEEAISFSLLILLIYFLTALFGFVSWIIKPIKI